jgi:predicted nucleotidyltransferase
MYSTPYPDVNNILDSLLSQIHFILGGKLVGLYLYGSLVSGDFDYHISDIDLVAVTTSDLTDTEFNRLDEMHNRITAQYEAWQDRIEIAYISTTALKTYKSRRSQLAIISPGEPFHFKEAGKDWAINWYVVREKGVALFGPPPQTIIDPITKEEFIRIVIDQTKSWTDWLDHIQSRPYQAYAILTMCRALYAYKHGEQVSKKQAALWAQRELPEWAPLINDALSWREAYRDSQVDDQATLHRTLDFVRFAISRVTATEPTER